MNQGQAFDSGEQALRYPPAPSDGAINRCGPLARCGVKKGLQLASSGGDVLGQRYRIRTGILGGWGGQVLGRKSNGLWVLGK